MKIKTFVLGIMFFVNVLTASGQIQEWCNLTPLESSREDVEEIIGKPEKYFNTFGIYQTEIGEFHVWYSEGGCRKNTAGFQYNVPANKLVNINLELKEFQPLNKIILDISKYKKANHPTIEDRFFYFSPNEDITYETVLKNSTEFVTSIGVHPGKDKKYLLCKEDD